MPGFAFDGKNPAAQEVAARQAGKLITGLSEQTREAIRAMVVRSIRDGIPPRDLARLMRPALGLNSQQSQALLNYRSSLIETGTKASEVERLADRYASKKLAERAETVARTEVMDALNDGALESWKQARDEGLVGDNMVKEVIVTDDDLLCPVCAPLDAVRVPIDSPFETEYGPILMPPFHPNCRCTAVMIPDDVPEREPQEAAQEVVAREEGAAPDAAVTGSVGDLEAEAGYKDPVPKDDWLLVGTDLADPVKWRAHEEAQAHLAMELLKARGFTIELPGNYSAPRRMGRSLRRPGEKSVPITQLNNEQLMRLRTGLDVYLKGHQTLLSVGIDMTAKEYKLGRIVFDLKYQSNTYAWAQSYYGSGLGTHQVAINLNCQAWSSKREMQGAMTRDAAVGFHPVPNYESIIVHEYGHVLHYTKTGGDLAVIRDNVRWGQSHDGVRLDIGVARQVSRYATSNPMEFVAETFTGMVYGKTYSPEVMKMYRALKGHEPPMTAIAGKTGKVAALPTAPVPAPPVVAPPRPPVVPRPPVPPPPGAPPKKPPKGVTQEEVLKVLELRKQGLSYEAIEKAMGWPPRHGSKAYQIVKKYGAQPPGPVPPVQPPAPPPVQPPAPPPVQPPRPPVAPPLPPPVQYPDGWTPKPNTPPDALRVIQLKLSGKTYEQIEQIMGWPPRHGSKPWMLFKKWGPPKTK